MVSLYLYIQVVGIILLSAASRGFVEASAEKVTQTTCEDVDAQKRGHETHTGTCTEKAANDIDTTSSLKAHDSAIENISADTSPEEIKKPSTIREIYHYYDCDSVFAQPRPIHDESTFMRLRQAYVDVVGEEDSSIPVPVENISKFDVPIYVAQTEETGRGVFAKEPIAKGQLIWRAAQSAYMSTADEYVEFLHKVGDHVVCDLLIWCYPTYDDEEEDEVLIGCDLDEGSFFNEGDTEELKNMYHIESEEDGIDRAYALRDIEAGEELLTWYMEFSSENLWTKFGLEDVWFDEDDGGVTFSVESW